MRFISAFTMSNPSRSRSSGNGGPWRHGYSNRARPPMDQPPPTNGTPTSNRRPYSDHNTPAPRGHGPQYAHGSHRPQFTGPPARGPGYHLPSPSPLYGPGQPYTAVPPPQPNPYRQRAPYEPYRPGPPNPMHAPTYRPNHNQVGIYLQPPNELHRPGPPNTMHAPRYRPNQNQVGMYMQPPLAFYKREWRFSPTKAPPQSERFQILSYNILADYLATEHYSELYRHVPFRYLNWEWRKNQLLFEFKLWSPDILCLQEVDRFPELQIELENRGYNGIYKIRTGNAKDGCAIFWRTNRFVLLHDESIQFNEIELRDNVAQICVLESTNQIIPENNSSPMQDSSNRVVVCNIHVLFNPKRGEIKLGQVRTLIDRAYNVSKNWNDAPVILCGDFNSTPMSPLYKFISEQKLDISGLQRNQISGQQSHARPNFNPNYSRVSSSNGTTSANKECTSQNNGTESSNSDPTEKAHFHEQINGNSTNEIQPEEKLVDEIEKKNLHPSTDSDASQELGENNEESELGFEEINQSELLRGDNNSFLKGDFVINRATDDSTEPNLSLEKMNFGEISKLEEDSDIFEDVFVINRTNEDFLKELNGIKDEEGSSSSNNMHIEGDNINNYNYNGYYIYDPYKWAPHEIKAASGREECTFIESSLKLRSVYTDVEGRDGTKYSNREPEVTSYHGNFMGTVDYIWSTEGLQTVKVLDTIPKQILKQTKGFPTKKWGSDHIALVCELAFTPSSSAKSVFPSFL